MPPVNKVQLDTIKEQKCRKNIKKSEASTEIDAKITPLDYEKYFYENKMIILNDQLREMLLFPPDDISSVTLPRRWRTVTSTVPDTKVTADCPLLTRKALHSYSCSWNLLHYKYTAFSGTYLNLPRLPIKPLPPEEYEIDAELDEKSEENAESLTKEGYLFKGPEIGSERIFSNFTPKLFKKRFCSMIREADGAYILEVHKDEKKVDNKLTIVMDFCSEVVKNPKKGRYCFELRMSGNKGYTFAAETESEFGDWLNVFTNALKKSQDNQSTTQSEDGSEKDGSESSFTSDTIPASHGTLKGLEHSMNPLLMRYSRETHSSIASLRSEARTELFSLPGPQLLTPEPQIEPFKENFGQRILLKCESLKFRLQAPIDGEKESLCQVEPYYTYLALYDARNGKKLTEDFHFDLNHDAVRDLVKDDESVKDLVQGCEEKTSLRDIPESWLRHKRQAIVALVNPHSEIFIVVRIDKILQGSINQVAEPYMKAIKDPRLGLKIHKQIKAYTNRVGGYRMPFAWSAKPLFRLYTNELDTNPDFAHIFRQEPTKLSDEDILKILADFRKQEKIAKLAIIPGWLSVSVQSCSDLPPNSMTSSYEALKPFPLPPTAPLTLEVASLGKNKESVYTSYMHKLYVRPKNLTYDGQKLFARARNIACTVQLLDSDCGNGKGLKVIYGRHGLRNRHTCVVIHHNTSPSWADDIKIRLPIKITEKHHLLFTFHHISCDVTKKQDASVETCIGYAWIPLLKNGLFVDEQLNLRIASHLPSGYLLADEDNGPEITWVESERALFKCSIILDSTVLSKDVHINNLFALIDKVIKRTPPIPSDGDIIDALKSAHAVRLSSVISFLPTLFNQLLEFMAIMKSEEVGYQIAKLFIYYIHILHDYGRKDLLDSYVKYVYTCVGTGVHDKLSGPLHRLVDSKQPDFLLGHKFMQYSSFFFDIIVKSMAMYLLNSGRIKMSRNERFNGELMANVQELIDTVEPSYILQQPMQTHIFNKNLANFLKACLSFMDRGFVFRQIQKYLDKFGSCEPKALFEFKFTFLQIVTSHEHYVPLNLPIRMSRSPTKEQIEDVARLKLTNDFVSRYYLAGAMLKQVEMALIEAGCKRALALACLKALLMKHEHDSRYTSKLARSRIAYLYSPWLSIVLENVHRLSPKSTPVENGHDHIDGESINNNQTLNKIINNHKEVSSTSSTPTKKHRLTLYFDASNNIRGSGHFKEPLPPAVNLTNGVKDNKSQVSQSSIDSDSSTLSGTDSLPRTLEFKEIGDQVNRFGVMSPDEIRDILLCYLFVLKYLDDDKLVEWWKNCTPAQLQAFLTVLELCADHFQYQGRKKIVTDFKASTPDGSSRLKPLKARTLPARMTPPDFAKEPTIVAEKNNTVNRENLAIDITEMDALAEQAVKAAGHLATEVGLIIVDRVTLLTRKIGPIGGSALRPYIKMMQLPQSVTMYKNLFAAIRAYINHHADTLFQGAGRWCDGVVSGAVRACGAAEARVRREAAGLLYLLMRANFTHGNITRTHLQIIISVSKLLDSPHSINYQRLQESLTVINCFATSDKAMKGTGLSTEACEVVRRVRTAVWARAGLAQGNLDGLGTSGEGAELYQAALAASCRATPRLRHAWLQALADHHKAAGNHDEAMCCQLHIAALIAEYLRVRGSQTWGADEFNEMSKNIPKEESGLKIDEGIIDVHYNEDALLDQLIKCTEYVERTERYELLGPLYRLVIPMYERRKDYQALLNCYQQLTKTYTKIIELSQSGKRLLGRFYRIAFFGRNFFEESEDGKQFVYKEPKLTTLSEVSEKFSKMYAAKFGAGNVKMIMDSAPVDRSTLDPTLAYIQVTWVRAADGSSCETDLDSAHNVKRFAFDTPFTRNGAARGPIEQQWCRHTVLTTEHWLPYIVRRSPVVDVQECERSPIEVALYEVTSRIADLKAAIEPPYDIKKLQLILQGSVCVQVNAGPLAYANAFLQPGTDQPEQFVQQLKHSFKEFLAVCHSALELNRKLISADQVNYHKALDANFYSLSESIAAIFGEGVHKILENGTGHNVTAVSGVELDSSCA